GSCPVLGYNYDSEKKTLEVNKEEADQIVDIFQTYLKNKSLNLTARSINQKGYHMKTWITFGKKLKRGGRPFNKANLHWLLRNPLYLGKIRYKGHLYDGEHQGFLSEKLFNAVNKILKGNQNGTVDRERRKDTGHNFMLKGIIRCGNCGSAMTPTFAYNKNKKTFHYYRCVSALKGDKECTGKYVSAPELERFVIDRIKFLADNKEVMEGIITKSRDSNIEILPIKLREKSNLAAEMGKVDLNAQNLVGILAEEGPDSQRKKYVLEELDKINASKIQLTERWEKLNKEIQALEERLIEADVIRNNLKNFQNVFQRLTPMEQKELVQLMVKEVVINHTNSQVQLTLRALPEMDWGVAQSGQCSISVKNGVGNGD
ncbi:MAG TPA: recombinase family protein, partial [Elusimicrobiota bacterium]|nr:recombinase family protein [Elusimicrobiota bacterium]